MKSGSLSSAIERLAAARRMKPGRSVHRQVSHSMAVARIAPAGRPGVTARSSDSPDFAKSPPQSRKKVFL